jgi:putative hydrolase of the HAD superfamily
MFDIIAFDADDTLWHNEVLYTTTQDRYKQLLSDYLSAEVIDQKLYETEMRNLGYFGYGIKGFTLSMIETAIELTEGRIQGREIQAIITLGKEMLKAPVQLLAYVEETVARLAASYPLMVITKGDLFDQETKIARSGLADYFSHIEIVSEKDQQLYQALLDRRQLDPRRFLMVGNSLKSDILPVVALGAWAVHIPYHTTWIHEVVVQDQVSQNYFELEHMGQLPALLDKLNQR